MSLSLYEAPGTEPVSLEELKDHARIDLDDDDDLLEAYITAAREWVESYTRRALVTQSWDLKMDSFSDCHYAEGTVIFLPKPPLQSVTSVSYVDTAGDSQTWASSNYQVDAPEGPKAEFGRLAPGYGLSYPSTQAVFNAVTIRYVAGYGEADDVPGQLKLAVKMLATHFYQDRQAQTPAGLTGVEVPFTIPRLCWPFRAMRFS